MSDNEVQDICGMLSQILDLVPKEVQECFRFSKPEFAHIPASFDMEKSLQRLEEFKASILHEPPSLPAAHFLLRMSTE